MRYTKTLTAAAAIAGALIGLPAAADPHKDESGDRSYYGDRPPHAGHYRFHEKRFEGKEEYWEGNCKIERKWEGNGEYKEERKCRNAEHSASVPAVVIWLPPILIGPEPR